jgi:hypothetical protein
MKDRVYKELEQVFDKILLRDFNAKVGMEDIFNPRIGMRVSTKLVMIMELE